VVLKRHDFGEADRVVVLFTRQRGKLRAVAKGVRRTTSRLAGHLELFSHAELQLARGRELELITQADTRNAFRRLREDLTLTSHAYMVAELGDALTEDQAEQPELFTLLVETFGALEVGRDPRLVVNHFQVALLDMVGYRPALELCLLCREPLQPGANAFSAFLGGALCPRCGPNEVSARPISSDVLKVLRNLQRSGPPGSVKIHLPDSVGRDVDRALRELCERYMERKLRSPDLIARLRTVVPV
jgi:DNA repair protein RecO (recombination protein O)